MKKLLISLALFLTPGLVWAAGDNSLRAIAGMSQGEFGVGVDFENRIQEDMAIGGFFFLTGDDQDAGKSEVMILGAFANFYIYQKSKLSVYLGPGVGLLAVDTPGGDDESTIGTAHKLGFDYVLNEKVQLGLQEVQIYNWMSDELLGNVSFVNFTVKFSI